MASRGARKPPRVLKQPVKLTSSSLYIASFIALVLTLVAGYYISSLASSRRPGVEIVRFDDRQVFILDDFFDPVTLDSWRRKLRKEWDDEAWVFATNNNGSGVGGGNQKVVSRERVNERKEIAQRLLKNGQFAYSKWELKRDNIVHREIRSYMEHFETRKRIESVLNVSLKPQMGDFFTSLYRKSDFLTAHSDTYGGTWAAVAYFCEGPTKGGTLSFFCQSSNSWCRTISPGPNR